MSAFKSGSRNPKAGSDWKLVRLASFRCERDISGLGGLKFTIPLTRVRCPGINVYEWGRGTQESLAVSVSTGLEESLRPRRQVTKNLPMVALESIRPPVTFKPAIVPAATYLGSSPAVVVCPSC